MDMARPRESQRTSVLARLSASSFEILTSLFLESAVELDLAVNWSVTS